MSKEGKEFSEGQEKAAFLIFSLYISILGNQEAKNGTTFEKKHEDFGAAAMSDPERSFKQGCLLAWI